MSGLAHAHGWKSKNIEVGEGLREKMKQVKKEMKDDGIKL